MREAMSSATIKFKELEYLLKQSIPELQFKGWSKDGARVEVPFHKLTSEREKWRGIELFRFEKFTVRKQLIGELQDVQVILR
jgi:hypothetical protein